MPFITVIIPTYNREKWLSFAIDSVLQQTYSDYELIIVDDGSNDATQNILDQYSSSIRVITLASNLGVSAARNIGIKNSDSRWVAFLDSDDRWLDQKLEKQIQTIKDNPDYKIHFTDEIWIRNGQRVNPMKKHKKLDGWIFQPSLSLCLMAPSTILIQRDVFENTGLFDEDLPVCEDYDLWLKITARFPVCLLDEKLMIRYGGHEDQLSRKNWGNDRYRVQSLQNILQTVPLDIEDYQATVKKLVEKCQILIKGYEKRDQTQAVDFYQNMIHKHQGLI